MLFHRLGEAKILWRQLKKCVLQSVIVNVEKIFGTMLVNGNEIFEKAGKKKKREDTYMVLEEIAYRNMLETVFPVKFHSLIPLGLGETGSSLFQKCFLRSK